MISELDVSEYSKYVSELDVSETTRQRNDRLPGEVYLIKIQFWNFVVENRILMFHF